MSEPANKWAFALRSDDGGATIDVDILDAIGEWSGPNAVTARGVVSALAAAQDTKKIRARINSGGGEVMEGIAIYNALAAHQAEVEVIVLGVAASMASVIAMAGDTITMAPGSFMMIHNPWTIVGGESDDLRHAADFLDKVRDSLTGIYAKRTKRTAEEVKSLMSEETWMKAEEAVQQGFADRVAPEKKGAAKALAYAALNDFTKVPEELRKTMRAYEAPATHQGPPVVAVAIESQTPPPGAASTTPTGEVSNMSDKPQNDPTNTMTVARALGLPAGATESDVINAAVTLRELQVVSVTVTSAASTAEAIGAIRGMASAAKDLKDARAELVVVKAERDAQNFEVVVARGVAEGKLAPIEEKYQRDMFAKDAEAGRGAERVEELKGLLKVKAADPRLSRDTKKQAEVSTTSTPLLWNGKAYRDLKPAARAALGNENPELFRLMKDDHEATA